jgi:membrane fusion protein (multidrug efflux system)
MKKRMFLMLAAAVVVIAGLGTVKYQQVQAAIAQFSSFQPPPEAVTTVVATAEPWDASLAAIGTVTAVHGVTVSADLPGIVERIAFESGRTIREGDVLVKLDARQEEAQLVAAESQRDLAKLHLDRMLGLRAKGVTSQAELDSAQAEHAQAEARVGEIRAAIARKTIRAPFTGALGIRQVNLGQYLSAGDPVVPLQSLHPIYVDFSVPQQQVVRLGPGTEVRVSPEAGAAGGQPREGADRFVGRVTAIDSVVDEATRNVRVQATFDNRDGALRPGMFVEARVHLGSGGTVVPLPASAVHYAPYGDSVFVVEELEGPDGGTYRGVRQQFVKLGAGRGDQVAVLSGVEPGEEVVTSGVFKLRNGAAVQVNNEVQPGNDPTPRPENS